MSKWLAVGSVPGALVGVWLLDVLHEAYGKSFEPVLLIAIAIVLLIVALTVLGRALFMPKLVARERHAIVQTRQTKLTAVGIGAVLGLILGITSVGSGALIGLALILVFQLTPHRVVGTDVFHAAILLWAAALAHLVSGNVDFLLMATILARLAARRARRDEPHHPRARRTACARCSAACCSASGLGVLKKAGVDVPPAVLIGVPLTVGAGAWLLMRERRRRCPRPTTWRWGRHDRTTHASAGARVRGDPRHARGRGRAVDARAAVQRRQGLDRAAAPRREGVSAGALPVSADARRHGPQLPRGHRVPRPPRAELGERLIVASVQESIDTGRVREETGPRASRNRLQTTTLLDAIEEHGFDAAFGGARRDEERARAKERIFSFRDDFGGWDPKNQRPEVWTLYNGRIRRGESVRVFPISNWTELDVWEYIAEEQLEVPSIYFAHERSVFARDKMLYAVSDAVDLIDGEVPFTPSVRYRTVGDMSCTGAVGRPAADLGSVVAEIAVTRVTERGETRADDRVSDAAMEDRKVAGYF